MMKSKNESVEGEAVFKKLLVIFLLMPVAELAALFLMAHYLGWGWTILVTLLSSLLGFFLARHSGRQWWRALRAEWREGLPIQRLGEGAVLLTSMALVITPGPLTGLVGLVFLMPRARTAVARLIFGWLASSVRDRFLG